MDFISRRNLLLSTAAWGAFALVAPMTPAAAQYPARLLGEPRSFDFNQLRQRAKEAAGKPYAGIRQPAPQLVSQIDFDAAQQITFRPDMALWSEGSGPFPIRLFHLDKFSRLPVRINIVSGDQAQEVKYSPDAFAYGEAELQRILPADLGYSGFRVMDGPDVETDWLAFRGASYFRSSGEDQQYGASARGIAVNTGLAMEEEFPNFVEFWLSENKSEGSNLTIYALLDGPSVTGAYKFDISKRETVTMDVTMDLFLREDVERLGIAPVTSMYWYGENDRRYADDWRPEIHDSDGLAIWTGRDEHIWRPLVNPSSVQTNSFLDNAPRGFGLMQRGREFASYEDDGAFYNRRPSVWVEPVGNWGEGAVQLVEIPTQEEILDNIVAFWNPATPPRKGDQLNFSYRLHWRNHEPGRDERNLGYVVATRIGRAGIPGQTPPAEKRKRKFVIDFIGGPLMDMEARYDVTPVASASRGTIDNGYVIKVVGTDKWRALFDLDAPGSEPIDLRCYLRLGDQTLTETWLYQYHPESSGTNL